MVLLRKEAQMPEEHLSFGRSGRRSLQEGCFHAEVL